MLRSMTEVISFYENQARQATNDYIRKTDEFRLRHQGDANWEDKLREFGLPRGYIDFINKYHVEGVYLGYFYFTDEDADVCRFLHSWNGHNKMPVVPDDMLNVANFEADPILVNKGAHGHPDNTVYFIWHDEDPNTRPWKIADDIEQVVLIMANVHKLSIEDDGRFGGRVEAFIADHLPGFDADMIRRWREISSTAGG